MDFLIQLQDLSYSQFSDGEIAGLSTGFPWGYFWLGILIAFVIFITYIIIPILWEMESKEESQNNQKVFGMVKRFFKDIIVFYPNWLLYGAVILIWIYGALVFHGDRQITSIQWNSTKRIISLTDNYFLTYQYLYSELSHIRLSIPTEDELAIMSSKILYTRMQNDKTVSIELITKGHEKFTLAKFPESTLHISELQHRDNGSDFQQPSREEIFALLSNFSQEFNIPLFTFRDREVLFSDASLLKLLNERGLKDSQSYPLLANHKESPSDSTTKSEYMIEKRDLRKGFGLVFSYLGNIKNVFVLFSSLLLSIWTYYLTHYFEKWKRILFHKLFGKITRKPLEEYEKKDFWKSRFFVITNLVLFLIAFSFIKSQDRTRLLPTKITINDTKFTQQQLEPGKDFELSDITSPEFIIDVYLNDPFRAWDRLRDLANLDFAKYLIDFDEIDALHKFSFWQGENNIYIHTKDQTFDYYNLIWDGFDPLVSEYLLYQIERRMK
ncbi:MAG: hypothetical protein JJT78_11015 [Leptospira sp.]|nr:hypothetical protein [Leptospira sp.]